MKKIIIFSLVLSIICTFIIPIHCFSFTKIVDLVFDGEPVNPEDLSEILETIKINKIKNKNIKNPKKLKPDKLFKVYARQKEPNNIQLEIDTSQVVVKSDDDIQAAISNKAFLDAITESIKLWDDVAIADVTFAPLKFASAQPDPDDGKNVVTFRAIETPEGIPDESIVASIITYARTDTVIFMNKPIMVKPGTILDADIVYDPANNPCLALFTTTGDIVPGGADITIAEGGIDTSLSPDDLANCMFIIQADITDLAVKSIANVLGLESSAIASAASSSVARTMARYALTNDDKIGLANIYPSKDFLTTSGNIAGIVTLNKKPVNGAHVVIEDTTTGEPIASAITTLNGKFLIKSIPAGTYNVYAEPLDGPIRRRGLFRNFFAFTADLNFTTGVFPTPIIISPNKTTRLNIEVKEISQSAFNINYLTGALTEEIVTESGGSSLLPIIIMPGETITGVQFWGSNISPSFGTLSVSGTGVTISNVQEDKNISISPFIGDPPPDVLPGISVDITCSDDAIPGPRDIIFTGERIDITHPSFGLRDQITGGLVVRE